jgi:hypothetical protein
MYVVFEKKSMEVIHINPAPLSQKLEDKDIYYKFDKNEMIIGRTELLSLPEHFELEKNGMIRTLTLEEQVEKGIIQLEPHLKLKKGEIVEKSLDDQIKDGLIKLSPNQKIVTINGERQTALKSLSEQIKDGSLKLSPEYKIIKKDDQELLVEKSLEERVKDKSLILKPIEKIQDNQIVSKTPREQVEEGIINLEEYKTILVKNYSYYSLTERGRILPDYKIQNALLGIYEGEEEQRIKATVKAFRDEFYRLKTFIENSKDLKELDDLTVKFPEKIL